MHIGQLTPAYKFYLIVLVQIDILPPGFKTLKISSKAFFLLGAKQNAPFEIILSIELVSKGSFSISASINLIFFKPLYSARIFACLTSVFDISIPITYPSEPTLSAAIKLSTPRPDPKSTTVYPFKISMNL